MRVRVHTRRCVAFAFFACVLARHIPGIDVCTYACVYFCAYILYRRIHGRNARFWKTGSAHGKTTPTTTAASLSVRSGGSSSRQYKLDVPGTFRTAFRARMCALIRSPLGRTCLRKFRIVMQIVVRANMRVVFILQIQDLCGHHQRQQNYVAAAAAAAADAITEIRKV